MRTGTRDWIYNKQSQTITAAEVHSFVSHTVVGNVPQNYLQQPVILENTGVKIHIFSLYNKHCTDLHKVHGTQRTIKSI